jgi:hypothetical protein
LVNAVKNTTEELRGITTQYATGNEVAQLHLAPSSSREASPDVAIKDVEDGTKGGKKRHKQHRQETAPMVGDYGSNNKQAGSSGVVHVVATTGSGKFLEETCANYAYLIKHKLMDCRMMKNSQPQGPWPEGWKSTRVTRCPFSEKTWS